MKEQLLIKVLEMLLDGSDEGSKRTDDRSTIHERNIGKYVIIRSRSEGINAGVLVAADETGCVLGQCRRLWYHKPNSNASWYEGVAMYGLSSDSKISVAVEEKVIIEDYSVTLCTEIAEKSICEAKANEASR